METSMKGWRQSRKLTLVVVTVAFVLDTVLVTVIVPMLPHYLKRLHDLEEVSNEDVAFNNSFVSNSTGYLHEDVHLSGLRTTNSSSCYLSTKIGVLLASKTFFELLLSPVFGKLTDRFGYTIIMLMGFFITFSSTLIFAFTERYNILLVARSLQGLGSAAIFAPGLGLLADRFPENKERTKAISISFSGGVFGLIIGQTFGGVMYELYGKTVPFLILAAIISVDGFLRALIAEPKHAQREKGPTMKELLADPYIIITLGGLFFLGFIYSMLESLLPTWVMETMDANSAQQGLVFLPVFLTLLLALNTLHHLNTWIQSNWMATSGLLLQGVCLILMPLAKTQVQLTLPTAFFGLSTGLVQCALLPHLGYLVDHRHKSVYGTVYGLMQGSFCLAVATGAPLGGILAVNIGFEWTVACVGTAAIAYAPLLLCIQNPSGKNEEKPLGVPSYQDTSKALEDDKRAQLEVT